MNITNKNSNIVQKNISLLSKTKQNTLAHHTKVKSHLTDKLHLMCSGLKNTSFELIHNALQPSQHS